MTPFLRKLLGMNWTMILFMYGLLAFGVIMIESAARHLPVADSVIEQFGSAGAYYAWMQKRWIVIGSLVYFAAAFVDYKWIRFLGIPFYALGIFMMAMAIGQDDKVHRVDIAGLSFQPAQLGIASGIVMIAWLIQDLPRIHRWLGAPFVRIGLIGVLSAVPFLMVMKMGDMGSALVWIPVVFVALLVGGVPFRYLSFLGFLGAGILPLLYFVLLPMVSERGPERIETWLRMIQGKEVDIQGAAWAPYNIAMAVGKAGYKGVGWNASVEQGSLHARRMIPRDTAHNDYIYAIIGEELGFRGSLCLILVFAAMLINGLMIAFYARDMMGRMLVCLVCALFFAHVFESIGMCVQLMPITGIPLPLVSYSGTFVVTCMLLLGLVQSVWIHRNEKPLPKLNPVEN